VNKAHHSKTNYHKRNRPTIQNEYLANSRHSTEYKERGLDADFLGSLEEKGSNNEGDQVGYGEQLLLERVTHEMVFFSPIRYVAIFLCIHSDVNPLKTESRLIDTNQFAHLIRVADCPLVCRWVLAVVFGDCCQPPYLVDNKVA